MLILRKNHPIKFFTMPLKNDFIIDIFVFSHLNERVSFAALINRFFRREKIAFEIFIYLSQLKLEWIILIL